MYQALEFISEFGCQDKLTFNRIMGRIYEIFRNLAVSFTKSHYSDTLQNTIHIFPNTKL